MKDTLTRVSPYWSALSMAILMSSTASRADAITTDQALKGFEDFVHSGMQSDFVGADSTGKECTIRFSELFSNAEEIVGPLNGVGLGLGVDTVEEFSTTMTQPGSGAKLHLRYQEIREEQDGRDITIDLAKDAIGQIVSVSESIVYIYPDQGFTETSQCAQLKSVTPSCAVSVQDNAPQVSNCPGLTPGQMEPGCSVTCQVGQWPSCENFLCGTDDRGNLTGIDNTPASCTCSGDPWF